MSDFPSMSLSSYSAIGGVVLSKFVDAPGVMSSCEIKPSRETLVLGKECQTLSAECP